MRQIITFLAGATIISMSSCSSTNKVAQTPDDVYYSPASPRNTVASRNGDDGDEYYNTSSNDNYVRMKSTDQARWSYFDDYSNYDAYYSPVSIGYGMGYGYCPYPMAGYGFGFDPYFAWNDYFMWNSWYNPYFYNPYYGAGVVVVNPKLSGTPVYAHLRTFNQSGYNNNNNNRFANGNNNNRFYRPTSTGSSNNNRGSVRYNNNNNTYRPFNTGGNSGSTRSFSSQPSQPARSFSAPSGGGGGGGGFRPGHH